MTRDMCLVIKILLPLQGVGSTSLLTQGDALGYKQVALSGRADG